MGAVANGARGLVWIILTGIMSVFIPALVKLIHYAATDDPIITFYGFRFEDGNIDEAHLIAGYCFWITLVFIIWLFVVWWHYPCKCVVRKREQIRRIINKIKTGDALGLRPDEIILNADQRFTVVGGGEEEEDPLTGHK